MSFGRICGNKRGMAWISEFNSRLTSRSKQGLIKGLQPLQQLLLGECESQGIAKGRLYLSVKFKAALAVNRDTTSEASRLSAVSPPLAS